MRSDEEKQAAGVMPRFRDGSYAATGWYGSLPSRLTVTARLEDDRLSDVRVETHATDPTSLEYQRAFAAAVGPTVIGRPLAALRVGKLAGASGCPAGFNAALDEIRNQASIWRTR